MRSGLEARQKCNTFQPFEESRQKLHKPSCFNFFRIWRFIIWFCTSLIFWSHLLIKLGGSRNYIPPILVPSFAKRIATQNLVIAKLNGRKDFILRIFVCDIIHYYVISLFVISFNINDVNGVVLVSLLLTVNIF